MSTTDFRDAIASMSAAIATHLAAVTDEQLALAMHDGFRGRLWTRVTSDVITAAVGVEFLRLPADAPHPWPGTTGIFYEIDDAACERVAAFVEGRSNRRPPPFKMEIR